MRPARGDRLSSRPKRINGIHNRPPMRMAERIGTWIRAEFVLFVSIILALISILFVPPSEEYLGYIDVPMLCILFCLMASVAGLSECGVFKVAALWIVEKTGSARRVCLALVALTFFSSMAITNDVSLITFVPLAIAVLSSAGRKDLIPWTLVLQTIAANLGCMLTPIGSPHNLFVCSKYSLGFEEMVSTMAPYLIVGGIALFASCAFLCRGESSKPSSAGSRPENTKLLVAMTVVFVISVLSVSGTVPYWIALIAAVAAMMALKPSLFGKVDYSLLLTFVFLFIFTGNITNIESVASFLGGLMDWDPMMMPALSSQVISNVPAAVLLSNFTSDWQSLLVGVNIGGFGTPIASMASLITFRLYAKEKGKDGGRFAILFLAANALTFVLLSALYYALMAVS